MKFYNIFTLSNEKLLSDFLLVIRLYCHLIFMITFGLVFIASCTLPNTNSEKEKSSISSHTKDTIPHSTITNNKEKGTTQTQKSESVYPEEFSTSNYEKIYRKVWDGVYYYKEQKSTTDNTLIEYRMDFFDTLGNKISEYDVMANNPYNKETVQNLVDENYSGYVYRSFIPKSTTEGKLKYKPTAYYTRIQMPSSETMPVVGYHLLGAVEDGAYGVTDWKFTAVCFDERGNILRKFKNLDIDPYAFCVSRDKKFFLVGYGGLRGENLTRLRNNGLRIYEIESGDLVYETEVDRKHRIAGPGLKYIDNYGGFSISGNDFSTDKTIITSYIDFDSRKIYSYIINNRIEYVKKSFQNRIIIKNVKSDSTYPVYFEKDFDMEKF